MSSKVEICRMASIRLGGATFTSLDESSKEARLCKLSYDFVRKAVLRRHPWNCAIKRDTPASSVTSPSFEYDYQFPFPSDCLRVLKVYSQTGDYKIEGKNILYNGDTISVVYVADIEDTEVFDDLLARAISLELAATIAIALTGNASIAADVRDEAKQALTQAKMIDGQEGSPDQFYDYDWIDGRL